MSTRKHPHRIRRRSHPRPSPQHSQPPASDADESFDQHLFQGLPFDPETDPYYLASRAFDPKGQPWLDPEPLARVDGTNAHLACADNPIHRVEPAGDSVADEDGC